MLVQPLSEFLEARLPLRVKFFFDFIQFLEKCGKILFPPSPGGLASPPRGNPGSATAKVPLDC